MMSKTHSISAASFVLLALVAGCEASSESGPGTSSACSASGRLRVEAGSGTPDDPWTIGSCEQLRSLDVACEGHFAITRDIDCSGVDFEPLGSRSPFRGALDGRGHAITGVEVRAGDAAGLFATTQHAEIRRLTLSVAVSGHFQVGGLVGAASHTSIREVGVEGSVVGFSSVAGLVGSSLGGEIVDSYARTTIECATTSRRARQSPKTRIMAPPQASHDACGALLGQAIGDVRVQDSYGIAPGMSALIGAGAPAAATQASFYDCEVGGACDLDERGAATSELQSVDFLERAGWDLRAVWGVRGPTDYPCHRFEERCGVVRVSIDTTLRPAPGHGDYQGEALLPITRLELDGDGFDFYENTFVLESHPDDVEETLQAERLEVLERDLPEPDDESPALYLVRALPGAEPCGDDLLTHLRHEEPGLDGSLVFAGVEARDTFCTFLRLSAKGLAVDLDAPANDDTYTRGSQVDGHPLARSKNVLDWTDFGMSFGVPYGIPQAWEALDAHGREPVVTINVAGTGFARHFDFNGEVGENFVTREDLFAGSERHGSSVAAVVSAVAENEWGVAGTAGRFVKRTVIWGARNQWHIRRAMRHARRQGGPSILVVSQSVETPRRLRILRRGMSRTAEVTARRNTLVVASASNDGERLGRSRMAEMPCEADHVLCIGGLASGTRTAAAESNWGSPVDLFAPNQGPGFSSDRTPFDTIGVFDGTSYSAPFVAGVAALVWTADPELGVGEVIERLRETASSGEDDRVTSVVNPYQAVVASLPSEPPLTLLEPGEVFEGRTIRVGEAAVFPGVVTSPETVSSVTWTSDRLGVLGTEATLSWTPLPSDVGRHLLELTATATSGLTTSLAFEVFVENLNSPPVIAGIRVTPRPYVPGESTLLAVDVSDADGDGLTYAWSASDVPYPYSWRPLGDTADVTTTGLTSPTYTWVRVVVTDSVRNEAEYVMPVAAINPGSPSIVSALVTYVGLDETGVTILRVDGVASDPEEGGIADRRFSWLFSGAEFPGRFFSANHGEVLFRLSTPFCDAIPIVTLTVRDSAGNTASRRATVGGCD